MKSIFITLIGLLISYSSFAGIDQDADLHLAVEKENGVLKVVQFYSYLETEKEVFEGQNVFEALTFRGEGLTLSLNEDNSKLLLKTAGKEIVLADVNLDEGEIEEGSIDTAVIAKAVRIELVHASLGKKIKMKRTMCLPGGVFCSKNTIRVRPHQYRYQITGSNGDILCIERGFNTTAENYGKVSDKYKFAACAE